MRIGELSARTGVPVATIKYYVREGLVSGGERTGHNQVRYGEEHVRRLRLVRAMVETGALPIAKVREVIAEVEEPGRDLDSALGVASRALASHRAPIEEPEEADLETARAIVRRRGWDRIPLDHPHLRTLADVIGRLRLLGLADMVEHEDRYALAAEQVAEADIHLLMQREERDEILETMIVGTVLGDALLTTLRRIAQVEISGRDIKGPDHDRADPECSLSTRDADAGPSAPVAEPVHAKMAMSALVGFSTVQVEWAVLR
ncbi:MerR family transcriptional regulator [Glycomyces tritici]|uniref:MerR family transcriptional regulator n=1 Tax=Glycomyces tritici TaxID=2665176 RepID=A0ABT7YKB5_9ACTN|nr:MerR family transcriptional regulator [Glycomyces tritici]MDN3239080.1 MerR family transcriptional regulator [Glycomyces tritici]MDN3240242.1 MerR family transcriptional regulator [Glycomyces tritici]